MEKFSKERLGEVGRYLAGVRQQHKLTLADVAKLAGFKSAGYLSVIENGGSALSTKTLEKLAKAYTNVTFEEMRDHIGFAASGRMLPEAPVHNKDGESGPVERTMKVDADGDGDEVYPSDYLTELLDAALAFIEQDRLYLQPPFSPQTMREKARDVALYQRSTGRTLLTADELQRILDSD